MKINTSNIINEIKYEFLNNQITFKNNLYHDKLENKYYSAYRYNGSINLKNNLVFELKSLFSEIKSDIKIYFKKENIYILLICNSKDIASIDDTTIKRNNNIENITNNYENILREYLNLKDEDKFNDLWKNLKKNGKKDNRKYNIQNIKLNEKYFRLFTFREYPKDNINLSEYLEYADISLGFKSLEDQRSKDIIDNYKKIISKEIDYFNKTAKKNGYRKIIYPYGLENDFKKVEYISENNYKVVGLRVSFIIKADTLKELDKKTKLLYQKGLENNVFIYPLTHNHTWKTFFSSLPFFKNYIGYKKLYINEEKKSIRYIKKYQNRGKPKKEKKKAKEFILAKVIKVLKKETTKFTRNIAKYIPINEVYSNGLIRLKNGDFIKIYKFSNVNFNILTDYEKDSAFKAYREVLLILPLNVHMQIFIKNENLDMEEVKKELIIPNDNNIKVIDAFNKHNSALLDKSKSTSSEKEYFLILNVSNNSVENAEISIRNAAKLLGSKLKVLQSKLEEMEIEESIRMYYSLFNFEKLDSLFLLDIDFDNQIDIISKIAPISNKYDKTDLHMGEFNKTVLYISEFPDSADESVINRLLNLPFSVQISIHLKKVNKGKAAKKIKRKISSLKKVESDHNRRSKSIIPTVPSEIIDDLSEMEYWYKQINSNSNIMYEFGLYISVKAKNKRILENNVNVVKETLGFLTADELTVRQKEGFITSNPFGIDLANMSRPLLLDSASIFIPFTNKQVMQKGGVLYGLNDDNEPIIVNIGKGMNASFLVIGQSGSGKSFFVKLVQIFGLYFTLTLLRKLNIKIIIMDPEGEYDDTVNHFGGQIIYLQSDSDTQMNPCYIDENYAKDEVIDDKDLTEEKRLKLIKKAISRKSIYVYRLIKSMIDNVDDDMRSIIDRCARKVYTDFFNGKIKGETTLTHTYNEIKIYSKKDETGKAKILVNQLYPHVEGSYQLLAKKGNINLNKDIISFNISNLDPEQKKTGLMAVTEYMWSQTYTNKQNGIITIFVSDEVKEAMKIPEISKQYGSMYKRLRKLGAVLISLNQEVGYFSLTQEAEEMFANAEYIIVFYLKKEEIDKLKKNYQLSQRHIDMISSKEKGTGIIIIGEDVIPFHNQMEADNELFKLIETTGIEI